MRTTLDIADDVLFAAKELARREKKPLGQVISELARKAFQQGQPVAQTCQRCAQFVRHCIGQCLLAGKQGGNAVRHMVESHTDLAYTGTAG